MPSFPTAILSTGLMILAFMSFVAGLVLDTVTLGRRELKRLHYLCAARPGDRRPPPVAPASTQTTAFPHSKKLDAATASMRRTRSKRSFQADCRQLELIKSAGITPIMSATPPNVMSAAPMIKD